MTPRTAIVLTLSLLTCACGGKKKPAQAADAVDSDGGTTETASTDSKPADGTKSSSGGTGDGSGEGKTDAPKKDDCTGFEIANLEDTLNKVACEAPLPKIDDKALDPKDRLDVKASTSSIKVPPGHHADLVVTLTNKSKEPIPLTFTIDPTPRFEVETYDAKNRRVDMPAGNPPPLPSGIAPRVPGEPKGAKVTLAPNGTARVRLGWDAVKMKWAPEKLRGTPPEKGYPRKPAGPLPKGKYTIKIVMPLVGVLEGVDHEISAPKIPIEVGN